MAELDASREVPTDSAARRSGDCRPLEAARLYAATLRHLSPSQPYRRIRARLGLRNRLGVRVAPMRPEAFGPARVPQALEDDAAFAERFDVEGLLRGKVTVLHETFTVDWNRPWEAPEASALWNFNLHYCEFLPSLAQTWRTTGERRYLEEASRIAESWIGQHPCTPGKASGIGKTAWSPYVASLRATAWLDFLRIAGDALPSSTVAAMRASLHEHLVFLEGHLELDILGNHLFENLKAIILLAAAFDDVPVREAAIERLERELETQVLADGMHCELSPMYHAIVLEGLLRVVAALDSSHPVRPRLAAVAERMLGAAATLAGGLERLPHFNDSATGVARSLEVLAAAARECGLAEATAQASLLAAGYEVLQAGHWRAIVDLGPAGYERQPGHAHCDMLSFELFFRGRPVLVNCGTYAYQSELRPWFRSTAAHNTLQAGTEETGRIEQSECWAAFRLGRRAQLRAARREDGHVEAVMEDHRGNMLARRLALAEDELRIVDTSQGPMTTRLHLAPSMPRACGTCIGAVDAHGGTLAPTCEAVAYSEEFGILDSAKQLTWQAEQKVTLSIDLARLASLIEENAANPSSS